VMEGDGLGGEVFNLGNPDERTMLELAEAVQRACDVELPFIFLPMPIDDPTRRCPDIGKARRVLGWSPTVGLDEGLRRLIAAFKAEFAQATVANPAHADA
jgi:UDP-glucuronate decarboxylase